MPKKSYRVLGLMSGTSLDGLDMAYCHFWQQDTTWLFELKEATTVAYSQSLYERLSNAVHLSEKAHAKLHQDYGTWLGQEAKYFLDQHGITVDFIASHGHTSHHRPQDGVTFQLGDGGCLARASGQKVICDFRKQDVALGGQGAPLVPIGDELLFSQYDFCLNLGGISNMSFKKNGKRFAYDIGMANMPLNYLAQQMGLEYDKDGKMAESGKMLPELLSRLNGLAYYGLPYPKSTGIEWFLDEIKPLLDTDRYAVEDVLHTMLHHNCQQLAMAIKKETPGPNSTVWVTGGGAHNSYYIEVLGEYLNGVAQVVIPTKNLVSYKEAVVFGFMGVLRELGAVNILASVTGAERDCCSGSIFRPN